jgi:hypothetical protein
MHERKTGTLLKQRQNIDSELVKRAGLELEIFKQVHSKCDTKSIYSGKSYAGTSATWECDVYNPKFKTHCNDHNIDSAEWIDGDRLI